MARATTLFVATDADLVRLCLAVRHSLEQPITSVRKNPVMRQVLAGASWDPGEGDDSVVIARRSSSAPPPSIASLYADGGGPCVAPVVAASSRAEEALEETAPLRLRALPHAAVVGVTGLELEALGFVLLGETKPPPRIVELLPADGYVDGLPTEALGPLAGLDDDGMGPLLERWNSALRPTGRRAEASALAALRALAREALARGGHVLTHMPA
jgi:hypothetical protein